MGGSLGITSQSFGDENNFGLSLSPFIRRYYPIVDDKFFFFLNGSVIFSYGSFNIGSTEVTGDDIFSIRLNAALGFSYFPSERWSLDFTLTGFSLSFIDIGGEGGTTTLFKLEQLVSPPVWALAISFSKQGFKKTARRFLDK